MKQIIFTICIVLIFKVCLAQSLVLNSETSRYEYSEVIEVDSVDKVDLFERFRECGMKATVNNQKKSISETR